MWKIQTKTCYLSDVYSYHIGSAKNGQPSMVSTQKTSYFQTYLKQQKSLLKSVEKLINKNFVSLTVNPASTTKTIILTLVTSRERRFIVATNFGIRVGRIASLVGCCWISFIAGVESSTSALLESLVSKPSGSSLKSFSFSPANVKNLVLSYPSKNGEEAEGNSSLNVAHSIATLWGFSITPLIGQVAKTDEVQKCPECYE